MKEKVKNPGDHRTISDPIPERVNIVKNIKKNASDEEKAQKKGASEEKN